MTLTLSLAFTLVTLGALLGAFAAWAVTTWRLTREPHCLDCECEGCEIVRAQKELIGAGLTHEEFIEAWRKARRAA